MQKTYFKEFDGARAIAALMVMFNHYFLTHVLSGNYISNLLQRLFAFGEIGVTIFFVLSGFLITRILIETKQEQHYFKKFYLRRSLRIFPLYFFFLALWYIAMPIVLHLPSIDFAQQKWYWLFLQNIAYTFGLNGSGPGHYWSLAIEEQFYLFWPLFIFLTKKEHIVRLCIILIIFANVLRFLMIRYDIGDVYYFTFTRMDELSLGALLAGLYISGSSWFKKTKLQSILFLLLTLIMAIITLSMPAKGAKLLQYCKYPLISGAIFFLFSLLISLKKSNSVMVFLRSKFMRFSGKISFGLYVYHPLVFMVIYYKFPLLSGLPLLIFCFGATYIIAWASFTWFESRFTGLKKYFNYSTAIH